VASGFRHKSVILSEHHRTQHTIYEYSSLAGISAAVPEAYKGNAEKLL